MAYSKRTQSISRNTNNHHWFGGAFGRSVTIDTVLRRLQRLFRFIGGKAPEAMIEQEERLVEEGFRDLNGREILEVVIRFARELPSQRERVHLCLSVNVRHAAIICR